MARAGNNDSGGKTNQLKYNDTEGVMKRVDADDALPVMPRKWQKHLYGWDPDIITTGDFSADSDWTKGAGWTIAAGVATHATGNAGTTLTQDSSLVTAIAKNTEYMVTYTITAYTSGGVAVSVGGTAGTSRTAAGTYTEYITSKKAGEDTYASSVVFTADATDDFVGSIDNVVVRKRVTDGVFTLTPLNAVESTVILDLREGYDGYLDLYFRTLTSQDATALDGMVWNGRQGYLYADDGEDLIPTDAGATVEIELASAVDMSVVDTVSGPFSITEEYSLNGSKTKYMHGAVYFVCCTNVGGAGGDTGTILVYVGKR